MSLRDFIQSLEQSDRLTVIREPVSKTYDIAGILKKLEPRPVLFENVKESRFRVVGNLFCGKRLFADYFGIESSQIIATLSEVMTLEPGDVIPTGTPPGVGVGRTPPLWMKAGDTIEIEIEKIGVLRNQIVAA